MEVDADDEEAVLLNGEHGPNADLFKAYSSVLPFIPSLTLIPQNHSPPASFRDRSRESSSYTKPHTVLIDVSPIVHGSYHSYTHFPQVIAASFDIRVAYLTAPDGTPVNAVLGFMRSILKIMKDFDLDGLRDVSTNGKKNRSDENERRAEFLGVCFDSPGSFRKKLVPSYKANREAPSEVPIPSRPPFLS